MKQHTYDRLITNPHFKLSDKQQLSSTEDDQQVVEFGVLPVHNAKFEIHPTGQVSLARSSRKPTKKKKL